MTLNTFSSDVVPIIQMLLTTLGLISLFLLWGQIRQANIWNKLKSEHNFIQAQQVETSIELVKEGKKIGLDLKGRSKPLTKSEVIQISKADLVYFALSKKLNELENICAAVRIGAADPDLAYATHSSIITMSYKTYVPFIEYLRQRDDDEEIYIELEKTALEWRERYLQTKNPQKIQVNRLKNNCNDEKGVQPKV
ncbi:MAG: DUF4760 domain-containing protein [Desulfotalea sp.]